MPPEAHPTHSPLVSIIVPTYNNEATIEACLSSLINQTYTKKEIIVINDGSTDGTASIVARMADQYRMVRFVTVVRRGVAAARNVGLREAGGEVVLFGEGDAVYREHYLEKAVACLMTDKRIGGVCVLGEPWKVKSTFVAECIDVENRIKHRLLREGKLGPYFAWVFRREAIDKAGGFDEKLRQGEDKDFFLRVRAAGYRIGLVQGVNWAHLRKESVWEYMRKSYLRGKSRILFVFKHRRFIELVRSVGPFWVLVSLLAISLIWRLALYGIAALALLFFLYKLVEALHSGWKCVPRKRYLLVLPIFQALRNLPFAFGYTHGLVSFLTKKARKKQVDWTNI